MNHNNSLDCPKSVSHPVLVTVGFALLISSFLIIKYLDWFSGDIVESAAFCIFISGGITLALDFFWQKTTARIATDLDASINNSSFSRTAIKILGLATTIGLLALAYWVFPEYHGDFYDNYWRFLVLLSPAWIIFAAPYFFFVDRKMREPKDGYWQMGQLALLRWNNLNRRLLTQHLLAWTVKGFFLPLMFTYFCADLQSFMKADFSAINDFKGIFDLGFSSIFLIDVAIVSIGYLLSLKLFDTQVRSTQTSALGWGIALICYEPFWSNIGAKYLNYSTGYGWGDWLAQSPVLYKVWGSCILILFSIYVWASVMFGCRFSNLTNRGILTNGPYYFSKHPAYLSKNLAWWMMAVPFLAHDGVMVAVQKCILLGTLNLVYYLRARTEETHLSEDPVYVRYAEWIAKRGLYARLAAVFEPSETGPITASARRGCSGELRNDFDFFPSDKSPITFKI